MKPARAPVGLWLAGILVVLLVGWWGVHRLPVSSMWQRVTQFQDRLVSLVQVPDLPSMGGTPVVTSTAQRVAAVPTLRSTASPTVEATLAPEQAAEILATPLMTSTVEATATAMATATATAIPPTATEVPTATPPPSPTPPPLPTATPDTNKYYTVRMGDSLMVIGDRTGIDWRQIAQVNNITLNTMLHPGDKLILPANGDSAAPAANTPASAPAAKSTTYTVKYGDSFAGIAAQFDLTWEEVARANGMNQGTMLQPGQKLVIPVPGAPQPTDTPAPKPTRTPVRPTASSVPPAPNLPAPALSSPSDGTPFQGAGHFIELTWQPVAAVPPGAVYQVKIQYLSGGTQQERYFNVNGQSLQVPAALWGQADQPGRRYSWNVTVVQPGSGGSSGTPLSQSSVTRGFSWN